MVPETELRQAFMVSRGGPWANFRAKRAWRFHSEEIEMVARLHGLRPEDARSLPGDLSPGKQPEPNPISSSPFFSRPEGGRDHAAAYAKNYRIPPEARHRIQ